MQYNIIKDKESLKENVMKKVDETFLFTLFDRATNVYHYGSYVYGTYVEDVSDVDYIVIVPNSMQDLNNQQFECNNKQCTVYTEATWQQMLNQCDVSAMECYFLPKEFIVKQNKMFDADLTREKIRNSFSRVASNSFVKCKKKLEVVESYNPIVGKKSLWHSLRIIDFGIQILTHDSIINYSSMNHMYDKIVKSDRNDWSFFKEQYKPLYNALKTKFRAS